MTNREFFNAIINGESNADIIAHAQAEIAKLDKKNEKRSSPNSKEKVEFGNRLSAIYGLIKTASSPLSVGELVELSGCTQGQVVACATRLITDGKVVKCTVKVDKKTRVCYTPILGE